MCGGSGRHSFERCFECKGTGLVEDEEPSDDEVAIADDDGDEY